MVLPEQWQFGSGNDDMMLVVREVTGDMAILPMPQDDMDMSD